MNIKSPLSQNMREEAVNSSPLVATLGHMRSQLSALFYSDEQGPEPAHKETCQGAARQALAPALAKPRLGSCHQKDKAVLAQEVGRWTVQSRLSHFTRLRELDAQGEAFWGEFRQLNERILAASMPQCLSRDRVYLRDIDLERLKRQELKPELVSQFVYWLLISPHGPECLVHVSFDMADKITDWLQQLDIVGAALFVRKSRFSQYRARIVVSQNLHSASPPVYVRRVGQGATLGSQELSLPMERQSALKPIIN